MWRAIADVALRRARETDINLLLAIKAWHVIARPLAVATIIPEFVVSLSK